jgi:hypothetical protein
MTEDEAKKKWCPMTRNIQVMGMNRNTIDYSDYKSNCLASECMMWRWVIKEGYPNGRGYCGLGGKL